MMMLASFVILGPKWLKMKCNYCLHEGDAEMIWQTDFFFSNSWNTSKNMDLVFIEQFLDDNIVSQQWTAPQSRSVIPFVTETYRYSQLLHSRDERCNVTMINPHQSLIIKERSHNQSVISEYGGTNFSFLCLWENLMPTQKIKRGTTTWVTGKTQVSLFLISEWGLSRVNKRRTTESRWKERGLSSGEKKKVKGNHLLRLL